MRPLSLSPVNIYNIQIFPTLICKSLARWDKYLIHNLIISIAA